MLITVFVNRWNPPQFLLNIFIFAKSEWIDFQFISKLCGIVFRFKNSNTHRNICIDGKCEFFWSLAFGEIGRVRYHQTIFPARIISMGRGGRAVQNRRVHVHSHIHVILSYQGECFRRELWYTCLDQAWLVHGRNLKHVLKNDM